MDAPVSLEKMTFADRDEFNRKSIAENIIKLLDADVDFCPMVIDGGWGTGKTEFCRKLINLIKKQDAQRQASAQETAARATQAAAGAADDAMPGDAASQLATVESRPAAAQAAPLPPKRAIIYLDAFASETVDDPLLCILAAIRAEFPEEKKKEISRKALPVVKTLGKVAGKAAFAHLFKQDLEDVSEALAEAAREGADALVEQTVDKLLDQYADAQGNIDALKEVIAKAAEARPILFFIDELDRCRPDVALSILELVKHVFDVPGVKFVFVANMQQLKAVIRKRYGQDVDADVYLEKFVNLTIALPPVDSATQKNAAYILIEKYFEHTWLLFDSHSVYKEIVLHFIRKHNISLRGIEKFIKNIKIYTAIFGRNPLSQSYSCASNMSFLFSMFVFTFKKELIHQVLIGNIGNEFAEFVGKSQDDRLDDFLFLMTSIICYGDKFSIEQLNFSSEKKEAIQRLLRSILRGESSYEFNSVRNEFINDIRVMNMLPISRYIA